MAKNGTRRHEPWKGSKAEAGKIIRGREKRKTLTTKREEIKKEKDKLDRRYDSHNWVDPHHK